MYHFSMSDQECRRNQIPGPVAAFVGRREPVDAAEPAITHRPAGSQGSLRGRRGGERPDSSAAVAKCDGPKLVHAGQTLPSKDLFAYRPNLPIAEDCTLPITELSIKHGPEQLREHIRIPTI